MFDDPAKPCDLPIQSDQFWQTVWKYNLKIKTLFPANKSARYMFVILQRLHSWKMIQLPSAWIKNCQFIASIFTAQAVLTSYNFWVDRFSIKPLYFPSPFWLHDWVKLLMHCGLNVRILGNVPFPFARENAPFLEFHNTTRCHEDPLPVAR